MNFLGDIILPNLKRRKFSTKQVVGEGKGGIWGDALTKGEVHECKLIKNIFVHSDLLQFCLKKKRNITEFFPDTTIFYD